MRSLIVEDEFVSRTKLQKILASHGECHVAVNGREGIAAFGAALANGEPYDLICMDILMPEIDGHEALAEIRKIEKAYNIIGLEMVKAIMITALDDEENMVQAYLHGRCEAYLSKPFDREKLLELLYALGLVEER